MLWRRKCEIGGETTIWNTGELRERKLVREELLRFGEGEVWFGFNFSVIRDILSVLKVTSEL